VNVHKNAVLTPRGREQLVARLERGESKAAAAAAVGVSERTAWKWLRRKRSEGIEGLQDRSSRPHRSPRRVSRARERQIARLRSKRWTQASIADALGIALSTVGAVCRRSGLGRLPPAERKPPIVRYERANAGELIHLDTKKLARIERVGHRIHGDRSRSVEGAGWEYLHVCIDDASRVSYAEVLPDEKGVTCTAFLRRAVAWFAERGVRVERVMTDNGSGYVSKAFRALVHGLGLRHIRTRPYTPRTNGKAERFIQTCSREWAYARPYAHSRDRAAALQTFLCFYNCHRPHWGIHRITPQLRLTRLLNNLPGCYN
jgi:transposase InsO family protein